MKKVKNSNEIKIYRLLLSLYPKSYLKEYKTLMEQTFKDMLREDKTFKVWFRILKELPGNLFQEHIENVKKGVVMEIRKRNFNLGLAVLILGYLTLISWALGIFMSVEMGMRVLSYVAIGFFGFFLLSSGILFIMSLVFNVRESKLTHQVSKGLKFTLISIPPIAFCYLAITAKALTEGH
ncbi:MAG: hypothetical protein KAI62_06495 [Actinomycetia bacterium]|nr:hypothetical protein [Actinomycetes bacterium]